MGFFFTGDRGFECSSLQSLSSPAANSTSGTEDVHGIAYFVARADERPMIAPHLDLCCLVAWLFLRILNLEAWVT